MKSLYFLLTTIVVLFAYSCAPQPGQGTPDYTIQYDTIGGVDPNLLSLDIYNDGVTGPAPVVIWVHGGGWAQRKSF
jgi:acetyl esterase/lipase